VARIPNNATTGGNKRGTGAVDLQIGTQAGADRVASGNYSFTAGQGAQASGTQSVAFNGIATNSNAIALQGGNATGSGAFAMCTNGTASGTNATVMSVYGNATASGQASFAGGSGVASGFMAFAYGEGVTANGKAATAFGYGTLTGDIYTKFVTGTKNSVAGDAQKGTLVIQTRTTGNTATTLTVDSTAGTGNQVILSNNAAFRFKGTIIGKQSGSTNVAAWDVDGIIVRGANAASTTLSLGNVTLVQNTPAWGTPTLAADTTNGGLRVQVTGAAATNIQWTAAIETTEVIYA
jgi:hypothetical protein